MMTTVVEQLVDAEYKSAREEVCESDPLWIKYVLLRVTDQTLGNSPLRITVTSLRAEIYMSEYMQAGEEDELEEELKSFDTSENISQVERYARQVRARIKLYRSLLKEWGDAGKFSNLVGLMNQALELGRKGREESDVQSTLKLGIDVAALAVDIDLRTRLGNGQLSVRREKITSRAKKYFSATFDDMRKIAYPELDRQVGEKAWYLDRNVREGIVHRSSTIYGLVADFIAVCLDEEIRGYLMSGNHSSTEKELMPLVEASGVTKTTNYGDDLLWPSAP